VVITNRGVINAQFILNTYIEIITSSSLTFFIAYFPYRQ
jgi:hypothetical protein